VSAVDGLAVRAGDLCPELFPRARALEIWHAALPLAGTLTEEYLLGRGIDLRAAAWRPLSLRHEPALFDHETVRRPWKSDHFRHEPALFHRPTVQRWPAMVAVVVGADGAGLACHRTSLVRRENGRWGKIEGEAKMTLGSPAGGAVRIRRGDKSRCDLTIAESIEDALSLALAAPERRVWAALGLTNMATVDLPTGCEMVTIVANNDGDNGQAAAALDRAIRSFRRQGARVLLARPPAEAKDVNELLTRGAA